MTTTSCNETTGDLGSLVNDALRLGGEAYAQYARMWQPSLDLGRKLWNGYLNYARGAASCYPSTDTCAVPETCCPPRCVCDLTWQGTLRDQLQGTITVTNTGKTARTFQFAATTLKSGGDDSGVSPKLQPASAILKPGESVLVAVGISLSQGFETGRTYTGEITIRGVYEQCVRVSVDVQPQARPHCDVQQGEMPMRVRAHHWYDHYQCEEPCFEPVGRTPVNPDGTVIKPQG